MSTGLCGITFGHHFQPGMNQCDCGHFKFSMSTHASAGTMSELNDGANLYLNKEIKSLKTQLKIAVEALEKSKIALTALTGDDLDITKALAAIELLNKGDK